MRSKDQHDDGRRCLPDNVLNVPGSKKKVEFDPDISASSRDEGASRAAHSGGLGAAQPTPAPMHVSRITEEERQIKQAMIHSMTNRMEKLIKENCKNDPSARVPDTFEAGCDKYDHTELYFARDMFGQALNDRKTVGRKEDETLTELYIRTFKITLRQARREVQHKGLTIPVIT